eukprot:5739408-Lingulodinium_polyedra.AAC.1
MKTQWQNKLEYDRRHGLITTNPGPMLEDPALAVWAAVAGQRQQRPDRSKSRGKNGKNKEGAAGQNGGGKTEPKADGVGKLR